MRHPFESAADLRVCQRRVDIPGGSRQDRERELAATLRHQGLHLVTGKLAAEPPIRSTRTLFHRIRQAWQILSGRGDLRVERRRSPL
ncbi:MAG TPA: hypothetical protein VM865_10595 [Acidobacteriaceae bacterium]|jgi:hypothetical protein|nr:hypothetical protein [Acidobacteriaceae bacterium]